MRQGENNLIHVLGDRFSDDVREDFALARSLAACDVRGVLKRLNRSRERWPRRARMDASPNSALFRVH